MTQSATKRYKIVIPNRVIKQLQKLPKHSQLKVSKGISRLKTSTYLGKTLVGRLSGIRSFKVWPYRILYQVREQEIEIVIVEIGHRQGVYKK